MIFLSLFTYLCLYLNFALFKCTRKAFMFQLKCRKAVCIPEGKSCEIDTPLLSVCFVSLRAQLLGFAYLRTCNLKKKKSRCSCEIKKSIYTSSLCWIKEQRCESRLSLSCHLLLFNRPERSKNKPTKHQIKIRFKNSKLLVCSAQWHVK